MSLFHQSFTKISNRCPKFKLIIFRGFLDDETILNHGPHTTILFEMLQRI